MIRVLQSLPNKFYRAFYGGFFRAQQGPATTDSSRKRRHQDGVDLWLPHSPAWRSDLHTTRWSEAVGLGGKDEEQKSDWEKSFKQRLEWDSFKRASNAQEAVGWGSIIVLGLQLGRYFKGGAPGDAQRRPQQGNGGIWSSLAQVLPSGPGLRHVSSTRCILPEREKRKERRGQPQGDISSSSSEASFAAGSDESVVWEFEEGKSSSRLWQDAPPKPYIRKPSASHSTAPPQPRGSSSSLSSSSSSSSSSSLGSNSSSGSSTYARGQHLVDDTLAGVEGEGEVKMSKGDKDPSDARMGRDRVTNEDLAATLDHITQQCWGQVNNIIGGHLATEGEEEKAAEHFRLASDAGYCKGQYNLGMCFEMGKGVQQDDVKAAAHFSMAARQGHPYAQYKLGTYHLEGRGNLKQCQRRALRLITQAASGGVIQAQTYLGMYYMTSEEEDPKKATMYLKAAALEKDPEAEYHLGLCYEFGWGVETNTAKAARLYHSAGSRHHPQALFALGLFHEQGLGGLPENEFQARELYTRASELGFDKASDKLREVDSESVSSGSLYSSGSNTSSSWVSNSSVNTASNSALDSVTSNTTLGSMGLHSTLSSMASSWSLSEEDIGSSPYLLAPPSELHSSCSAPQLTSRQRAGQIDASGADDGDGAQSMSLLHSLSCLSLVLPQLNRGWSISSDGDGMAGRSWTVASANKAASSPVGYSKTDGVSSHVRSTPKVRFQLGGEEEEEGAIDWCEPIDALAQRRVVSFRQSATVM